MLTTLALFITFAAPEADALTVAAKASFEGRKTFGDRFYKWNCQLPNGTERGCGAGGHWDSKFENVFAPPVSVEESLKQELAGYDKTVTQLQQAFDAAKAATAKSPNDKSLKDTVLQNQGELDIALRVHPRAIEIFASWAKVRDDWQKLVDSYAVPVGASLREKSMSPPQRYRGSHEKPGMPGTWGWMVDAQELFEKADASRFVFLRKEANRMGPQYTFRPIHRGEAVLVSGMFDYDGPQVAVFSVDGVIAWVSADELSAVPLAGAKVMPLKAAELDLFGDDDHNWLAGPSSLEADTTGFYLEEKPAWLQWVDPPEPRTQSFIDAREKIVGCYNAALEKVDPTGDLRRNYNFVTYNVRTGETKKMESAAAKLDRDACAKCGCKKFNELKRKLATDGVTNQQKALFAKFKPAIERVNGLKFDPKARLIVDAPAQ